MNKIMETNIPFILYSSDGWGKNKILGVVKEYNEAFCKVVLFLNNSEITKETDENGNIISFGIIEGKRENLNA